MKATRSALMKWLARSLVKCIPMGEAVSDFAVEVLPVVSNDVYEWWKGDKNAEERRKELEALADASPEEIKEEVKIAVEEAAQAAREGATLPGGATTPACDPSPELLDAVERYLEQVPDAIRRSMRRPDDTSGRTVPPHLMPRTGGELGALLPQRPPRFKAGDKPLPGVDLVLVAPLGAGGFGEVWRAHKTHLNQDVALKFCLDPSASQSLRNETSLLSRLMNGDAVHPGIVRLLNTYNDCTALEYEFVEGGDLAGVIRNFHAEGKKPAPRLVIEAIRQVAEIVAFAHGLTPPLVHRDLKPQNILVNKKSDGSLRFRLTDFGIGGVAKDAKQAAAGVASGFTQKGSTTSLHGSYSAMYASPQQMRAERPQPTDDVYSLGVIFWQMASGDMGEGAPGGTSWMRDLEAEGYPKAVVELMSSCFERRAEKRPATAGALVDELKKAFAPPPMPERRDPPKRPDAKPADAPPIRPAPDARAGADGISHQLVPTLAGHAGTATFVRWTRSEGDRVRPGDRIAELTIGGVGVELVAGAAGVLTHSADVRGGAAIRPGTEFAAIRPDAPVGPPPPADPRGAERAALKTRLRGVLDARPLDVTAARELARQLGSMGVDDAETRALLARVPQQPKPRPPGVNPNSRNTVIVVTIIVIALLLSGCITIALLMMMHERGAFETQNDAFSNAGVEDWKKQVNADVAAADAARQKALQGLLQNVADGVGRDGQSFDPKRPLTATLGDHGAAQAIVIDDDEEGILRDVTLPDGTVYRPRLRLGETLVQWITTPRGQRVVVEASNDVDHGQAFLIGRDGRRQRVAYDSAKGGFGLFEGGRFVRWEDANY